MIGRIIRALAVTIVAGLALAQPALAQPVSQWAYDVNPATGNGRATYLGDVTVKTLTGGGCVQADSAGKLTVPGGSCSGGVSLSTPQTWTATQTFQGSSSTLSLITDNIGEGVTVSTSPSATTTYDVLTQSVVLYTSNAANNWTLNIRGDGSTSLNSVMSIGQAVTIALIATQGGTAFYNNAVQIDGSSVTPIWQGGAPTAGNINGKDVYTYTVIKTASATFTVLASQVQFK